MSQWKSVSLDEAFTLIRNGKSIKQSGKVGLPITRIETISNGTVDFTKFGYAGIESIDEHADYLVKYGDILMSHINSEKHLGKVAVFESLATVIHGMNLLCLRASSCLNSRYAFYFFKSKIFLNNILTISNKSVNQASFSVTNLRKIQIPLPPLSEQQRIVARLDKAQQLINQRKEQLALMDDLIQSLFYEMFGDPVKNEKGWEIKPCNFVADILTGYPFVSKDYAENQDGTRICGGLIIMPNEIAWADSVYWPKSKEQGLEKFQLMHNDIVIAMDRPWISSGFKIGMIKQQDLPTLLGQRTARLRAKLVNQYYLYFLLKSGTFKRHCKLTETTVPHLSIKDINTFEVAVPPLPLQQTFADRVQHIEALKQTMTASLKEMEQNFQALMQEAFGG